MNYLTGDWVKNYVKVDKEEFTDITCMLERTHYIDASVYKYKDIPIGIYEVETDAYYIISKETYNRYTVRGV